MRLNAITPADNPMEELLFCFGGDGDSGDSGSSSDDRPTTSPAQRGGLSSSAARDTSRDAERDRDIGSIGTGGGRDDSGGRDAFDMSGDYVSQSIASFQSPSVGVMATPMQAATGRAGFSGGASPVGGGRGGGSPVSAPAVTRAPAPSIAPNLVNQPLSVGGAFSMPYDSFQRSPQQMFGYGGLTASPYSPSQISFQGGSPAASFDPLGGSVISQFDMGRAPSPAGVPDDRNFLERAVAGITGAFDTQPQRAGVFDPRTGTFQQFDGQTTLEKTSDNMLADFIGNAINPFTGLTGILDTKTYTPLAGGEDLQYSTARGGLLSGLIGENLVPYSELGVGEAGRDNDGDEGMRQPLIIPTAPEDEEGEDEATSEFPQLAPREYRYQPFTSNFYTIPSRFTQPRGLI